MTMPRCCLTTPDPGQWTAGKDDTADPQMVAAMHGIRDKLSYQMPVSDLVWALKASINIDSRTMLGGNIQHCLLSNAAHRLAVLALHVEPRPHPIALFDRIRDAWAVYKRKAVAIYVKEPNDAI